MLLNQFSKAKGPPPQNYTKLKSNLSIGQSWLISREIFLFGITLVPSYQTIFYPTLSLKLPAIPKVPTSTKEAFYEFQTTNFFYY